MKTPISKFLLVSTILLFALSGMRSDRVLVNQQEQEVSQTLAEGNALNPTPSDFLQDQKSEREKESEGFRFPNVFDALRFIF